MNVKVCIGAVGLGAGMFVNTAAAQIVSQAPNGVNGYFSDTTWPQSMADNFSVGGGGASLGLLTWYGGYFPSNTIVADDFAIRIHGDAGGVPNGSASFLNLSNVTPDSRTDTGVNLFGVDEYVYTFDLGGVNLGAGTYWIEIYNDTMQNSDNWFWETGNPGTGSVANVAFAVETPGVNWSAFGDQLAFTLVEVPAPASLALLGLAGACGARRRR